MRTVSTYIGNTAYPLADVIEQPNDDGILEPMPLTGVVSEIRLMAQNPETGVVVIDQVAMNAETSDPATIGMVEYTPADGDVAAEKRYIAWWRITLAATGKVADTPEFQWFIIPHGVHAPGVSDPTGVCTAWASNVDIETYTPLALDEDFTPWLIEASELLYILSARQFPGVCSQTVRPIRNSCGCWQVLSRGHVVYPVQWDWIAGYWRAENEAFQQIGCGALSSVRLSGYVRAINSVKIGGVIVDPTTYRVDDHERLVRLTDPVTGQNPGWPACQDLTLPADAPGTFEVDYDWGRSPPIAGVRAAATLAWQLYLNDNPRGKEKCKLPAGWTSITRQGITITRSQVQKLATDGTGIVGIDAFLSTANPNGLDREPAVYSRDIQPFAPRIG